MSLRFTKTFKKSKFSKMSNTVTLTLVGFLSMTCLNILECAPVPQVKTTLSPFEEMMSGTNVLFKFNNTILEETMKGDALDIMKQLERVRQRQAEESRKYEEEKRNREWEERRKEEQERRDRIANYHTNNNFDKYTDDTYYTSSSRRSSTLSWWVIFVFLVFCGLAFAACFYCCRRRRNGIVYRAPPCPITPAIYPNYPTTTTVHQGGFLPVTIQNAPIQQPQRSPLLNDGRHYPTQTYSYPVPQPQPQPTIVPSAPTNVEPELDLPPSYDELDLPPDRQRNKRGNISGPSW